MRVTGAKALNATIKAAAAVETTPAHPDGQVTIQTTAAHGFLVGSHVYIEGTTNYDGLAEILAVPAADTFTIKAKYVAETFGGTETVKVAIVPDARFVFVGFSIKLSSAPSTSENFTITLDADDGSAYDVNVYTRDFSSASDTDVIWTVPEDELIPFEKLDKLRIAWTNTDGRTFGLKLWFKRLQ
jgi:hypothetical protein